MITQEELKKTIVYDPDTGLMRWLISPSAGVKIGDIAGSKSENGRGKSYVKVRLKGSNYYAHRLAWLYMSGSLPQGEIDHVDGDGQNNKLINLRSVSRKDNMRNRKKPSHNKSGVSGVHWNKEINKWVVQIVSDKKKFTVGYYGDINDAIRSRKEAENKFGYHKNHGADRNL